MAYAAVAMAAATEPKHGLATLAPLAAHSRRPPHGLISAPTAPSSRSSLRPSRRPLNVRPNGAVPRVGQRWRLSQLATGNF